MDEIKQQRIFSKQADLRELLNSERDNLVGFIEDSETFQGILSTCFLDILTSGASEQDALQTTILLGIALGRLYEQGKLEDILKNYPTPQDIASTFVRNLQEIVDDGR